MIKAKKSVEYMNGYPVPLYDRDWDLKIDSNENNYGPSPKVIEALKNCNYKQISFYPFYGKLSHKIADFYGANINNIKVTNGADEAIQGIIQTYLEQDEALLTLDVSFEMPVIYTKIQGGKIIKVPFKEKWIFPIDDFVSSIDDSVKIIYIASPNNPTGSVIEYNDLIRILEKAKNQVVIIDETYANYSDNTFKNLVNDYDNVFLVRSFSKDFALAGLRLGCIISNEANIKNLKKVISPYSVNSFAILAGLSALDDYPYFLNIKNEVNASKAELALFFESLGAIVYASNANFLLANFKEKAEFIYNKLKNNKITVKLFKEGSGLKNHLRVTIPTKKGVESIKNILKKKTALVFDMDGVLIDARNSYRKAVEKTYEKYTGKTISHDEIQNAKNMGGLNNDWDLTQYFLKKAGYDIPYENIVETFNDFYWNNAKGFINNEELLFDKELFEELSQEYNLSIFTGRLKHEALFAVEKFKLDSIFYPIITTDDIPEGMGKPNPYGLNLTRQNIIAEKFYYFGDTPDDMKAAKDAGYIGIGVLPPQDKSSELESILKSNGAKLVIKSVNDIKNILELKNEAML